MSTEDQDQDLTPKELLGYYEVKTTKIGGVLGKLNTPFAGLSDMNNVTHLFFKYGQLITHAITAISWANLIINIFNHLFSITVALMLSRKNAATRTMRILTALGLLSLGIASTAAGLGSFVLVLASCCLDTSIRLWALGSNLLSHAFGEMRTVRNRYKSNKERYYELLQDPAQLALLKEYREHVTPENKHLFEGEIIELDKQLTDDKNKITKKKVKLANQTHGFAITAMTVIGASLLFTPAILVGGAILIAMAIYAVADTFGVNPLRWLVNKWQGNKYAPKTHHKSIQKIEAKLDKTVCIRAEDELMKQKASESTATVIKRFHHGHAAEGKTASPSPKAINTARFFNSERVPCNDPDYTEGDQETVTPMPRC